MAKWIMDVVVNYMHFKLSYTCLRNIVLAFTEVESKADVAFFSHYLTSLFKCENRTFKPSARDLTRLKQVLRLPLSL